MLPGVILIVGMLFLKESPRHLARVGRWEEASKALCWIRSLPDTHNYIEGELLDMRLQLENEGTLVEGIQHGKLLREMFTIKSNLKRLLFGCAIQALQQLMGVNAINYCKRGIGAEHVMSALTSMLPADSPTIFAQLGLSGTSTSLFATGVSDHCKLSGGRTDEGRYDRSTVSSKWSRHSCFLSSLPTYWAARRPAYIQRLYRPRVYSMLEASSR